jgi:FKBP-type peptidyl-prolyl cis-trans isomerase 2
METTTTATKGTTVKVHYRGTLDDGTEFDSSYTRGEPIGFTLGSGEMIDGFDAAVAGMAVGEKKTIRLEPSEAYGDVNPNAFTTLSREAFPEDFPLQEGNKVPLTGPGNEQFVGTITTIDEGSINIDLNHPMAGKDLNFELELVDIEGEE